MYIQLFWNMFSSCKPLLDGCQSQPSSLYYPPINFNIEMPGVALHDEKGLKNNPLFKKCATTPSIML